MTHNGLLVDEMGIVGTNVKFERIRRITGYLVGTLDRFNNGKAAEERDRVKHMNMDKWQRADALASLGV